MPSSRRAYDAFTRSDVLPFDLPSPGSLRSSRKKVFANWVVSLPLSIDNLAPAVDYYATEYLDPTGEDGRHAAYGGYLRDRPLGRRPLAGDWRMKDLKTEVRQAISAGIDGFTMVVYTLPGTPTATDVPGWNTARMMMQAAAAVDPRFKIIPMPDMSALTSTTADHLAQNLAYLATFPSIYRTPDGRPLFSPFYAELRTVSWWSGWLDAMAHTYGKPAALWPTFLDETRNQDGFAPIIDGIGGWGGRDPVGNATDHGYMSAKYRIGLAHALGKPFMTPVSVQDERPRAGTWLEAGNLQNLRNTWDIAIDGRADWAQLLTWNDLPESSGILPSLHHGWALLDLMAYYTTWFKTGRRPVITKDAVYLTHRKHFAGDRPTFPQSIIGVNIGPTPTRNNAEAQLFLTAPATVTLRSGSSVRKCRAPAGISTCTVPLGTGAVRAKVVRHGTTTVRVTSPWAVTHMPFVQDLQYVGVSSLREGWTGRAAWRGTSRAVVTPVADTYVDENAPTTNFGWSSQLLARGGARRATGLLRFELPKAPPGKKLVSAFLNVRTSTAPSSGSVAPAAVSALRTAWRESRATWRNRPRGALARVGQVPRRTAPDTRYRVPLARDRVAANLGRGWSLAVTSTAADDLALWSTGHENAAVHPRLVLVFR